MDTNDIVWGGIDDCEAASSSPAIVVHRSVPQVVVTTGRQAVSGSLENWIEGRVESRLTSIVSEFCAGARSADAGEHADRISVDSDDIAVSITNEEPTHEREDGAEDLPSVSTLADNLFANDTATSLVSSVSGRARLRVEVDGDTGRHLQKLNESLAADADTTIEEQVIQSIVKAII
jgi:hypothetical protein